MWTFFPQIREAQVHIYLLPAINNFGSKTAASTADAKSCGRELAVDCSL